MCCNLLMIKLSLNVQNKKSKFLHQPHRLHAHRHNLLDEANDVRGVVLAVGIIGDAEEIRICSVPMEQILRVPERRLFRE